MKKNLQVAVLTVVLAISTAGAQTGKVVSQNQPALEITGGPVTDKTEPKRICATEVPHGSWDNLTPAEIKELEKTNYGTLKPGSNAKQMVAYTIPIIFHIVHTAGNAVGVGNNISQAQILSQLATLNADMKSSGFNSGLCPAVFAGVKADADITFCLATKNPTGGVLAEPGIDRRPHTSITGLASPGSGYSPSVCQFTIKPQSIWDPLYYCNVWVTELSGGILGYASFPIGTGLIGITGNGTATTDGVVCDHNCIGSIGTASSPFNKGRTLVHELGHWLGLRHINGDSNCGNDFVTDTPTQDVLHSGCPASTGTYHANFCSGTTGEMTMNYMDYTNDACAYMWTSGQKARMQQTMANGTYRKLLSASSATLCSLAATTPTANIFVPAASCAGTAITPTNSSSGYPAPTYVWSTTPTTGVTYNPNNTSAAPLITFANPGNYTVTCVATNSLGNNSNSKPISISTCGTPTANIFVPALGCAGTAITPTNSSSGSPVPTYVWSTTPTAGVTYNPNNTSATPLITFANAGNYTVTCVATNSLGNNSNSKPISISTCGTPTANIFVPALGCAGAAITPTNSSSGSPVPTYVWSTTPTAGVTYNPNNTSAAPLITFANAGNYTVTCVATNSVGNNSKSKPISITACATLCNDSITNVANTATMNLATAASDINTPGCSPKAGYVYGSNCYKDQEKAEFFPFSLYSSIPNPKIVSVIAIFYKDGTKGTGGAGSTNVPMKIYNGTMAGGPTGTTTPLATVNANMTNILAASSTNSVTYIGQNGVVYTNPILKPYRYLLTSPINAPTSNGFFASIKVPTTAGDTAVVMHASSNSGTNWEYASSNNWNNVSTAWGGFKGSMALLAEISCGSSLNVNQNSVLDKNIAIMPNPSSGIVNVITFLPNAQDINITVTNMLGQVISSNDFTNVTSNTFTVDLTTKDNGVYLMSIRNGEERIVKRVIITK